MSYKYKIVKLGDVVEILDNRRVPLSTFERSKIKGEYRYYGAQGIIDYINDYIFDGEYVLLAEDGENLRSRKMPLANLIEGKFWVNNHAHILKGTKSIATKYLYYLLNYNNLSPYITGTTQPKLSQQNMKNIELRLPDMTVQNKVVDILSSFDKKIELNTSINSQICKIRNSYVRNVFNSNNNVDFLEIPITDVAEIQGGYSYKSSEFDDLSNIGMLTIKNFSRDGSFKGDGTKRISPIKAKEAQYVNVGDIVVSHTDLTQDADIIGRAVSVIDDCGYDKLIASCDLVKVSSKDKNISNEMLSAILSTEDFHLYCQQYINGTTVLHLSKKALPNYKIKIPKDKNLIQEMNSVLVSLNAIQTNILKENRTLSELRDALLPKLMSGEIVIR